VRDVVKVTIITNTESQMLFQLTPKSTTLYDLECPCRTLLHK